MNGEQLKPQLLAETLRAGIRNERALTRTGPFLEQIDARLGGRISPARKDVGISGTGENIQFIDRAYYYLVPNQPAAYPTLSVYIVPERIWWGISAWGSEEEMSKLAENLQRLSIVQEVEDLVVQKGSFTPAWKGGWLLLLGNELSADLLEQQSDIAPIVQDISEDLVDYYRRLTPHMDEFAVRLDKEPQNRAWLFQANPQYFDLADATNVREIQAGSNDSWAVMRYGEEMQPGDSVVLWQSGDRAGIYALGFLTSEPYARDVDATEEEIKERPYLEAKKWVNLQYTQILEPPVLRDEVKKHPVLSDIQVMQFPRGTNFRLTTEEWEAVEKLVGKPLSDSAGIDELVALLLPNSDSRRICLEYFADCVKQAHRQTPANWGVTVLDDRIRLNVGSVVAFTLEKQKIWLAADELSQAQRTQLSWRATFTPEHDYNSMEPVTTLYVPQEHVTPVRAILQEKQFAFLDRAAETKMRQPSKDVHSTEFVEYLGRFLGRDIPQPAYVAPRRIFKIAPGHDAKYWVDCLKNGYICVGWDQTGDLRTYESREAFEERFNELFSERYNDSAVTLQRKAEEVWTLRELKSGDIVVANQGKTKVLAMGTVVSPGYEWNPGRPEMQHTVHVNWDTSYEQDIPTQSRWGFHTVLQLPQETYQKIISRDWSSGYVRAVPTLEQWLSSNGFYFTPWQIATFFTALQTKGFAILSGISGTGKSKLAQHFARALPQPRFSTPADYDEVINITVQPYMLKYSRFIIPKGALPLYEAPPAGEAKDILVLHGGEENHCRLTHETSGADYVVLYLRGRVTQWFRNTFTEGDTMLVEPLWTSETEFQGFHLQTEESYQLKSRTTIEEGQNWHFTAVRPDWRDSKSLLGYYNPLTGSYEWTPFLRFLLRVVRSYRRQERIAWFVILDEMNLAHAEYYFADLLSVLESGRDEAGWTREALQLVYPDEATGDLPPREIYLPPNLYIVGTVNVDETTHAFSPKVQDRAFTLELTEADFTQYPPDDSGDSNGSLLTSVTRRALLDIFSDDGQFVRIDKERIARYVAEQPDVRSWLQALNERLRLFGFHFGYRVFDEIVMFLIHAEESQVYEQVLESVSDSRYDELDSFDLALDAAVLMKVLPKLHGTRGQLEKPLKQMLAWCVNPADPDDSILEREDPTALVLHYRLPHTADRLRRMLQMLYATGFAT